MPPTAANLSAPPTGRPAIPAGRGSGNNSDDEAELAFYHSYIDHYRIAEHFYRGNLLPDERQDFQAHLNTCQECADRVLLAEIFAAEIYIETRSPVALQPERVRMPPVSLPDRESQPDLHSEVRQAPEPAAEPVAELSEAKTAEQPQAVESAPTRTRRLPPIPTEADAKALESLLASLSLPRTAARPGDPAAARKRVSAAGLPAPAARREARSPSAPVNPLPSAAPVLIPAMIPAAPAGPAQAKKVCAYLADQSTTSGGHEPRLCPLPMHARIAARFTLLEILMIFAAFVLILLALPSAMFLWELSRIAR